MTEQNAALQLALAYHRAWTNHDLDTAMAYIADDIVCEAPAGRITGAAAYRAFLEPFAARLRSAKMIAAFGDDDTALVMYDTETAPVPATAGYDENSRTLSAPGAECVTVSGGRITHSRFLFDRTPFLAARSAG